MTIKARLEKLELLNPAPVAKLICCFPAQIKHTVNERELAPGVWTSIHFKDHSVGGVRYDSIEQLTDWLNLPEQRNDKSRDYIVPSQAELDELFREIDAEC